MAGIQNVAAQWSKRASVLANWTMAHVLNRTDLWGRYLPPDKQTRDAKGKPILTRLSPVPAKRGILQLNERTIARHYRGEEIGHLIGVQPAGPGGTSRWVAVDTERDSAGVPAGNRLAAVLKWREQLAAMGFRPLLIDADGIGGYHLIVLFRNPVPTAAAHEFVRQLVGNHASLGLAAAPAILPSSPKPEDDEWLRLPGRHPTRNHWSRVWSKPGWQEGADAAVAIVRLHGDAPAAIQKWAALPRTAVVAAAVPRAIIERKQIMPINKPIKTESKVLETPMQDPGNQQKILGYLMAAARTGRVGEALAAGADAGVTAEMFDAAPFRPIFLAIQRLHEQGESLTPTAIASAAPESDRPAILSMLDKLMLEKPVARDEFQVMLAGLVRWRTAPPPPPMSATSPGGEMPAMPEGADEQLRMMSGAWPRLSAAVRQSLLTLALAAGGAEGKPTSAGIGADVGGILKA